MDPNDPHYIGECEFDEVPDTIEYDPWELPFMQEDYMDTLLQKKDEYKGNLVNFQGKEPRSIQILKIEYGERKESDKAIRNVVNTWPPSYPYIENIPYITYSEGSLAFIWDKRKGKPKYDQKDDNAWLYPYIIKKKSEKEKYYLTTLDRRNIPVQVDGSLLRPYIHGTWLLQGPGPR